MPWAYGFFDGGFICTGPGALYTFIVYVNYVKCEPFPQSKHVHDKWQTCCKIYEHLNLLKLDRWGNSLVNPFSTSTLPSKII
jgi:hypothetical protein